MIRWLDDSTSEFPAPDEALGPDTDAPGLLAAGRELNTDLLKRAYRRGIFPWFSPGQPVLWWCPDPRMVLKVADFKISRSLRKTLCRFANDEQCEIRIDSAFERVIAACAGTPRAGQNGTWITPKLMRAYCDWHAQGWAHSFETWVQGELVGGLYGIGLGRMFFGESMFSHRTDASKVALAALISFCRSEGVPWIDCQQNTSHLASLGAAEVPRSEFLAHLDQVVGATGVGTWTYDRSRWAALGVINRSPVVAHPDTSPARTEDSSP